MADEKQRFEFHYDEQQTTWVRATFYVEADTLEEAEALVRDAAIANTVYDEFDLDDFETLYDVSDPTGKFELISCDNDYKSIYMQE